MSQTLYFFSQPNPHTHAQFLLQTIPRHFLYLVSIPPPLRIKNGIALMQLYFRCRLHYIFRPSVTSYSDVMLLYKHSVSLPFTSFKPFICPHNTVCHRRGLISNGARHEKTDLKVALYSIFCIVFMFNGGSPSS